MPKSALNNHSVAVTGEPVARRAINIETFLAALHDFPGHLKRKCRARLSIHFARVEQFVGAECEVSARNSSRYRHARGLAVFKKVCRIVWIVARLDVHILTASRACQQYSSRGQHPAAWNPISALRIRPQSRTPLAR